MSHQSDTPAATRMIRPAAASTGRAGPRTASRTSHRSGAIPIKRREDALMPPARRSTSPSAAGARQSRCRVARIVSPTIQGNATHGSSSTEIRAVNASW